jgi:hypothetical protein
MTINQGTGHAPEATVLLVPLYPRGLHYAALFTEAGEADPDPALAHELRSHARFLARGQQRSALITLLQEAQSGVVGNAASAVAGSTLTATSAWLLRRRGRITPDAAAVAERLRSASMAVLGRAPQTLAYTNLVQQSDGSWKALVVVDGTDVQVTLDKTGALLEWQTIPAPTGP